MSRSFAKVYVCPVIAKSVFYHTVEAAYNNIAMLLCVFNCRPIVFYYFVMAYNKEWTARSYASERWQTKVKSKTQTSKTVLLYSNLFWSGANEMITARHLITSHTSFIVFVSQPLISCSTGYAARRWHVFVASLFLPEFSWWNLWRKSCDTRRRIRVVFLASLGFFGSCRAYEVTKAICFVMVTGQNTCVHRRNTHKTKLETESVASSS